MNLKEMSSKQLLKHYSQEQGIIYPPTREAENELLSRLEERRQVIETMAEILNLSKQLVYDEAFGGCVRKVILKYNT